MQDVDVSSEVVEPPHWMPDLGALASRVFTGLGLAEWQVSVLLCDEARITDLNREYRDIDAPTDVLTFPADERDPSSFGPVEGDIAVSLPIVFDNAAEFSVPEREELIRVYVHALLHLIGFTHDGFDLSSDNLGNHPMLGLQERLVRQFSTASPADLTSGEASSATRKEQGS